MLQLLAPVPALRGIPPRVRSGQRNSHRRCLNRRSLGRRRGRLFQWRGGLRRPWRLLPQYAPKHGIQKVPITSGSAVSACFHLAAGSAGRSGPSRRHPPRNRPRRQARHPACRRRPMHHWPDRRHHHQAVKAPAMRGQDRPAARKCRDRCWVGQRAGDDDRHAQPRNVEVAPLPVQRADDARIKPHIDGLCGEIDAALSAHAHERAKQANVLGLADAVLRC